MILFSALIYSSLMDALPCYIYIVLEMSACTINYSIYYNLTVCMYTVHVQHAVTLFYCKALYTLYIRAYTHTHYFSHTSTDCVFIITTVIPPVTTYSTVGNDAGKDAASTLSALSVMTLLVVALTAFVTF